MKCSKCGDDVEKLYHQGNTHLCETCLMTVTHIHYKPLLCRVCNKVITQPFSLLNQQDNTRFCSIECMATAAGFHHDQGD